MNRSDIKEKWKAIGKKRRDIKVSLTHEDVDVKKFLELSDEEIKAQFDKEVLPRIMKDIEELRGEWRRLEEERPRRQWLRSDVGPPPHIVIWEYGFY